MFENMSMLEITLWIIILLIFTYAFIRIISIGMFKSFFEALNEFVNKKEKGEDND